MSVKEHHTVRFFNTMNRKVEEFKPINPDSAGIYTCGPTVYNYAHIGNFRAYVFEDILCRTLRYFGYDVTQIMNLTDVDDKTIRDSQKAQLPLKEFTAKYIAAFFDDLKALNIQPAKYYPPATEHIPEMIALVQTLIDKGYAYQAPDKCVYFSISKFPEYGKLAKIDMENQISGVRIANDEYAKDSVADFALWKAWTPADGPVKWDSPWGPGRPGWHIECSAMSMKYLGKTFDIHTGGIDNMFPHHEDEIAQSESANGCTYVNTWIHCAHLMVNGEKMSKSAGNFYTLRDLIGKGWNGREIRFVLAGAHYRSKLNFTFESLEQAREGLKKFDKFFARVANVSADAPAGNEVAAAVENAANGFASAIADDLNTPMAIAACFTLMRDINKIMDAGSISAAEAETVLNTFRKFDTVLACFDVDSAAAKDDIPAEITALAQKRQDARKAKDFATADACRDQLKVAGYVVEDTPQGFRITRI